MRRTAEEYRVAMERTPMGPDKWLLATCYISASGRDVTSEELAELLEISNIEAQGALWHLEQSGYIEEEVTE